MDKYIPGQRFRRTTSAKWDHEEDFGSTAYFMTTTVVEISPEGEVSFWTHTESCDRYDPCPEDETGIDPEEEGEGESASPPQETNDQNTPVDDADGPEAPLEE